MKGKWTLGMMALAGSLLASGCVERMMLIRSEPVGAPVWVDEQYAGVTPLEYPFAHYGSRGIRVGPVRDEKDKVQFREQERVVRLEVPWYETFPIDFFFEVLWPFRLSDRHYPPAFRLEPAAGRAEAYDDERMQQLLERAQEFREKGLAPVPEEALAE